MKKLNVFNGYKTWSEQPEAIVDIVKYGKKHRNTSSLVASNFSMLNTDAKNWS